MGCPPNTYFRGSGKALCFVEYFSNQGLNSDLIVVFVNNCFGIEKYFKNPKGVDTGTISIAVVEQGSANSGGW